MTRRARVLGAFWWCAGLWLALLCTASPAHAAVERTQLPNGSALIIRRDAAVPLVAMELWFRAPSIGFHTPIIGLSRYAASAIAASPQGREPSLSTLIKNLGGRLVINAYADAVSVAVSVPADQQRRVLRAVTRAYFTPIISTQAMRTAVRDVAIAGTQQRLDPQATLHDALFSQLFSGGAAHYATVPTNANALSRVSLPELKSFATRAFRSTNAIVTVAGRAPDNLAADFSGRSSGQPMENPVDSVPAGQPTTSTRTYEEDAVGYAWLGPPIRDVKAATALDFIADYLFRADTGVVAQLGRADAADTFLSGQFITLHDPGVMMIEMAGKQIDRLQAHVEDQLQQIKRPLSQSVFDRARTAFQYHILSDTESPLATADNFGWYAVEGDPLYAPSDDGAKYLQVTQSLDPGYVARIAQQYLGSPTVVRLKAGVKS
ncbi:MAG: insulinase family protein [Candidatus Eremiobacteraeota bacterium]|nr:insulinase family protein [Candidatus Eremiobacteraeota bacterium]